ncbi:alanine and proline-rich secreted protein Apa-like isoform X2 [Puntigrus tetrazona]|uniref:alanine and proline-rich secreted protein Apa-like isoform X2 n=1 Tax=Puntigrus tetrazona TaxID=1606681 RepID=UPI001C89B4F8|nr:alanine and proline-rich secreted protein Apa-like isoform X2 [Puntigrus tetrazona]
MTLFLISPHLLMFISLLSLTRAQTSPLSTSSPTTAKTTTAPPPPTTTSAAPPPTTAAAAVTPSPAPTTTSATTTSWTAPAIFYPFGATAGDIQVLESGHGFSFILLHYGDCAGIPYPVEAGYDTIGSTDYYVIHYDQNSGYTLNLKTTTNVGVPGRWAFLVNNGTETVIGVQMKLRSFLDLTQSEIMEVILYQIKQELVNRGVSSNFELKFRKIKKTQS